MHITVVDINEYAPLFLDASYVKDVDEGQLYEEIIRVEAMDRDCTPRFGDICKYDILNDDQPFTINNEGILVICNFFFYKIFIKKYVIFKMNVFILLVW